MLLYNAKILFSEELNESLLRIWSFCGRKQQSLRYIESIRIFVRIWCLFCTGLIHYFDRLYRDDDIRPPSGRLHVTLQLISIHQKPEWKIAGSNGWKFWIQLTNSAVTVPLAHLDTTNFFQTTQKPTLPAFPPFGGWNIRLKKCARAVVNGNRSVFEIPSNRSRKRSSTIHHQSTPIESQCRTKYYW